jgi:FAD/FMN-containing dehydrogenase
VKNVVGYDLTQLLVGSEGTLAIITEITLRLVPKPAVSATLQRDLRRHRPAVGGVTALLAARVVPATIEIVDAGSLAAVERYLGRAVAPSGTGAMLLIEVDGVAGGVAEEAALVEEACRAAGALGGAAAATGRRARGALGGAARAVVRAPRVGAEQDQSRRLGAAGARAAAVRPAGPSSATIASRLPPSATPATATST